MKTLIKSSTLKAGLSFVSRILSRQSIATIILRDGNVEAFSANGRAFFRVGDFDFTVGLKPEPLQAALSCGVDEILVDCTGQQVLIQSGSNLKLRASKAEVEPDGGLLPLLGCTSSELPAEFPEAVRFAAAMAHTDPHSGKDHILLDSHNGQMAVVGFDGSNAAASLVGFDLQSREPVFLPLFATQLLAQFDGGLKMATDGRTIGFRNDTMGFTCPLLSERKAAKYSLIEAKLPAAVGKVDRAGLLGLLNAYLKVHAPSGNGAVLSCAVELKAADGKLSLISDGDQFDGSCELTEPADGEYNVVANGLTLSAGLAAMDCDAVEVRMKDGFSPIAITPDGGGCVWMGMPMRGRE